MIPGSAAHHRKASTTSAKGEDGIAVEDIEEEDEEEEDGAAKAQAEDPAQMALPTFLMAGTIVGSIFRVDMTKVKVDVETNDLSKSKLAPRHWGLRVFFLNCTEG